MLYARNRLSLPVLAAVSLAGYLLFPLFFPLLGQYDHAPLRDIRFFAPSAWGGLAYGALFLALCAFAILACRRAARDGTTLVLILVTTLVLCLPLLLTYPINATDIFRYFIRGRVTGFYGQSALTVPPDAFPQDPYLPLAGEWAGQTSPYGPLWELVAAAVTVVSRQNLLGSLLSFKLLAVLAHTGIGWLIWQALASRSHRYRAAMTLLWSWDPALLLMFAVDGHNDALMIFWLVAGYVLMKRRPLSGFLVAALAALTKPIAAIALPLLLLAHWRAQERWRDRARFLLLASAGSALLALLTFLPFGSPFRLVVRLFTEASESVGFSPGILIVLLAQRLGLSFDVPAVLEMATTLALALFVLLNLWLAWRVWRGTRLALGIAGSFAAYLITTLTFRIWYSMWPFPWLLLSGHRRPYALSAGFWFLCTAHLSILIYGHLRIHALSGDQVVAHLLGVPFTFLLPFLLARFQLLAPLTGVDA